MKKKPLKKNYPASLVVSAHSYSSISRKIQSLKSIHSNRFTLIKYG
jgi:hypothetical protein